MNDQNSKFNQLITNNIGAVLKEDDDEEQEEELDNIVFNYNKDLNPGVALLSMVYDNRKVIASSVYKYGKQQVSSRLPYIPFINPKKVVTQEETNEYLVGNKQERLSSPFASPLLGKALMTLDSSRAVTKLQQDEEISVDLSQQNILDQQKFDQLMTNLDDEVKIDIFLDSLDEKTKINLLHLLRKDLNMYNDQDATLSPQSAVKTLYYNENISTIDKVQIFIIISVKLFITGIKLFIPITRYLVYKFQQNQMYIFNAKNMNKFFNFLTRLLEGIKRDDVVPKWEAILFTSPNFGGVLELKEVRELIQRSSRLSLVVFNMSAASCFPVHLFVFLKEELSLREPSIRVEPLPHELALQYNF